MATTVLQSLQQALHGIFGDNPKAVLLGEDVLDPYGGAFKVTAGLSTTFPGRVLTTPISEAGITGVATGLALRGYRPIVEIMFGDFLTLCADQIVNHATKFTQMYGEVVCPLVVRTPMGGGRGYGPTHSQSIEKMFLGIPGLKIIASSHAHDPGAALRRVASAETMPVLFIEHKLLYGEGLIGTSADLPLTTVRDESGYDTAVLRNFTSGDPDVALIAYGGAARLVIKVMKALAAEEIRILAVLPECIDPLPADTLASLAGEADRIVIVDEGYDGFNWATGVASALYPRLWGRLACPIRTVSTDRAIIPTSFDQEAAMLVSPDRIEAAIMEVLTWG